MATLINLLPDVRQAKLRAKRLRQITAGLTSMVIAVCVAGVVVLFLITQGQKLRMGQLANEIKTKQATIDSTPDLGKMLTTQAHLASLPGLYQNRVLLTQFFSLLSSVSPKDISLENLEIAADGTLKFTVEARSYTIAAKFAQALEASNVTLGDGAGPDKPPHFTKVTLNGVAATSTGKVNFTATANVSPEVTRGRK